MLAYQRKSMLLYGVKGTYTPHDVGGVCTKLIGVQVFLHPDFKKKY
jgi:hypothetical protein